MAESEEERAKRELREAVRRAVEEEPAAGMAAPYTAAAGDLWTRAGGEMTGDKSKGS